MKLLCKKPATGLCGYVNAFVNIECDESEKNELQVYPTGFPYLTYSYLNLGSLERKDEKVQLPRLFISGQATTDNIKICIDGRIGHFGVEFFPSAIYKLFQIPMTKIKDDFYPFGSYIQNEHPSLYREILESHDFDQRVEIFSRLIEERVKTAVGIERVDHAICLIMEDPNQNISDICEEVAVGDRQLRRSFKEILGISPKTFAKLRQIKDVYLMIEKKDQKLSDLALECGYYDVPHFINSFKKLVGANPTTFLENYDKYLSFYLSENRPEGK